MLNTIASVVLGTATFGAFFGLTFGLLGRYVSAHRLLGKVQCWQGEGFLICSGRLDKLDHREMDAVMQGFVHRIEAALVPCASCGKLDQVHNSDCGLSMDFPVHQGSVDVG